MSEPSRRDTLTWLGRATGIAVFPVALEACGDTTPLSPTKKGGYGRDPPLLKPVTPWPLTMRKAQREFVARVVDMLLPADDCSPAASALGVHLFVDEWISAPYPTQRIDRARVLTFFNWLKREVGDTVENASNARLAPLLDRVCDEAHATAADRAAAIGFDRLRQIALVGYFTHEKGMAALGYTPALGSTTFAGPSAAVVRHLDL